MDYKTAIELAKQRMREIGKKTEEFHIEFITVVGTFIERDVKLINIKAPNQYYYLVDYQKHRGLYILSDTGYFNSDNASHNTTQEFTGAIQIGQISDKTWSLQTTDIITGAYIQIPIDFITVTF